MFDEPLLQLVGGGATDRRVVSQCLRGNGYGLRENLFKYAKAIRCCSGRTYMIQWEDQNRVPRFLSEAEEF